MPNRVRKLSEAAGQPTYFMQVVPAYDVRCGVVYRRNGKRVDVMSRAMFRKMVAEGVRVVAEMDAAERQPIPIGRTRRRA